MLARHDRAVATASRRFIDIVIIGEFTAEFPELRQNSCPHSEFEQKNTSFDVTLRLVGPLEPARFLQIAQFHSTNNSDCQRPPSTQRKAPLENPSRSVVFDPLQFP